MGFLLGSTHKQEQNHEQLSMVGMDRVDYHVRPGVCR